MPHEDHFSNVKNSYIKSVYYSICYGHGVNADKIWLNGDWFYTAEYGVNKKSIPWLASRHFFVSYFNVKNMVILVIVEQLHKGYH